MWSNVCLIYLPALISDVCMNWYLIRKQRDVYLWIGHNCIIIWQKCFGQLKSTEPCTFITGSGAWWNAHTYSLQWFVLLKCDFEFVWLAGNITFYLFCVQLNIYRYEMVVSQTLFLIWYTSDLRNALFFYH